ncbi:hypothetical protein TI05_13335 [Achromatium sp. WMS3]|nr:hypothetical protein TI05_13335 [Achromatium sp. WMS3]
MKKPIIVLFASILLWFTGCQSLNSPSSNALFKPSSSKKTASSNNSSQGITSVSPTASRLITLGSNIRGTTFYIDDKKIGQGQPFEIPIRIEPNKQYTVKAQPDGYEPQVAHIRPPYNDFSRQFTFLKQHGMAQESEYADNTNSNTSSGSDAYIAYESVAPFKNEPIDHKKAKQLTRNFTTHALVIGNNNYLNKPWGKLQTAVFDAQEVAEVLKKRYGYKVKLLIDATRDEILQQFTYYRNNLTRNTALLIYYAGHGWLDKEAGRAYWIPVDGGPLSDTRNWIANDDITSTLKAMKARHVLVISDSCFSGTLTRGVAGMADRRALLQIKEKRYADKYYNKNIWLIGVEFSKTKRNIQRFEWEQV